MCSTSSEAETPRSYLLLKINCMFYSVKAGLGLGSRIRWFKRSWKPFEIALQLPCIYCCFISFYTLLISCNDHVLFDHWGKSKQSNGVEELFSRRKETCVLNCMRWLQLSTKFSISFLKARHKGKLGGVSDCSDKAYNLIHSYKCFGTSKF